MRRLVSPAAFALALLAANPAFAQRQTTPVVRPATPVARPATAQPTTTQPATAQPATAQPATAQPATAQPATAQPAAAVQPSPEVEAEHAHGIELRRQQRDGEARDVFRGIYERTHEPRALARQAAAEGAMGEWIAAEEHLSTALGQTTDPWITQNRAGLESDLAGIRTHVGLLDVVSSTPHAELWIAGVRSASLPLANPLHVRAGTISVEVRAEGYLPEIRPVTVLGGLRAVARETVNLTADVQRPIAPVLPPVVVAPVVPVIPREGADTRRVPTSRIVGLSLLGAGVIGLGVGVAGVVVYSGNVSSFNGNPTCGSAALNDTCRPLYDAGLTARTVGITGIIVGGALVAGGLTALALSLRGPTRGLAVSLAPSLQGVDLSLSGRF
jgi:hypothetical protein